VSSFAWLDFSESDRKKALDVIDLFREKGTVDELGMGTIRDAIADLLFPGTSTIMTRARYYLFIPWIYLRQEQRKTASNEIGQLARKDEIALIAALKNGGESQGVIGVDAGPLLKRLPSTIYWQSLGVLGIRRYEGSLENYNRALDSFYKKGDVIRGDDGHVVSGGNLRRWDPALPPAPERLLKESSLALTKGEANYLRERVMHAAPHSLFAFLVNQPYDDANPAFPWDHESASQFPMQNREELMHARNFAEAMHGSALLYNLMLAEKRPDDTERITRYQELFEEWATLISAKRAALNRWSRADFWKLVHGTGARIPPATVAFVTVWLDKAIGSDPAALEHSKGARDLIIGRERMLKRGLARLTNARALDLWGGASSSERLNYRWNRPVTAILADVRQPLD
jgi:hypothetical protein